MSNPESMAQGARRGPLGHPWGCRCPSGAHAAALWTLVAQGLAGTSPEQNPAGGGARGRAAPHGSCREVGTRRQMKDRATHPTDPDPRPCPPPPTRGPAPPTRDPAPHPLTQTLLPP